MSNYYGYTKEQHEWAERIIERELVLCNELQELYAQVNEDWRGNVDNWQTPIEYTLSEYAKYVKDACDDPEDIATELSYFVEPDDFEYGGDYIGMFSDFIAEKEDEREVQEVYQWYLVDSWLANHLREIGEPVLDTDSNHLWGRTCCGQAIILDGTFQKLYAHIYQDNEVTK